MVLPEEYIKRIEEIIPEKSKDYFATTKENSYKGLRLNPLKITRESFLMDNPFNITEDDGVSWCRDGFYYSTTTQGEGNVLPPGKHPLHAGGAYYIQEPSAMSVVEELREYLENADNPKVLDLCASPGGKSTQLAGIMKNKGLLVSNEINKQRAENLSENIERLGIANAIVISHDPKTLTEKFKGYFDVILVDAPCSGEGMFRKNPEAISEWSLQNVELCIERQQEILDSTYEMLKPGGQIVYSTCTFEPGEDEEGVEVFLGRHKDLTLLKMNKLWPHEIRGEGHFLSVIKKAEDSDNDDFALSKTNIEPSLKDKDIKVFFDFQQESLNIDIRSIYGDNAYTFLRFKDELYIAPPGIPNLKGLRVLRPGLHLGTMKKDRFEPSFSLAVFLSPFDAKISIDITYEEALKYLRGETLQKTEPKGWCLLNYNKISLSFGKSNNGIIKNHYPKGLRNF